MYNRVFIRCHFLYSSDLAFLVLSSTNAQTRSRGTVGQVVDKYYATYDRCLKLLGLSIDQQFPQFTLESFRKEFEEGLVEAFLQARSTHLICLCF
jgi:hypothetical protein